MSRTSAGLENGSNTANPFVVSREVIQPPFYQQPLNQSLYYHQLGNIGNAKPMLSHHMVNNPVQLQGPNSNDLVYHPRQMPPPQYFDEKNNSQQPMHPIRNAHSSHAPANYQLSYGSGSVQTSNDPSNSHDQTNNINCNDINDSNNGCKV